VSAEVDVDSSIFYLDSCKMDVVQNTSHLATLHCETIKTLCSKIGLQADKKLVYEQI
jgi:hypothetical protein